MIEEYIKSKFHELMTVPWEDMPAHQLGIIDGKGRILKSIRELDEETRKFAYPSLFHSLCWNARGLMERCGDNPKLIGQLASTAFRIREFCVELKAEDVDAMLREEVERRGIQSSVICEKTEYKAIDPGTYVIRGKTFTIDEALLPIDEYFGHPIYRIGKTVFTAEEVAREDAPANAVGHGNIAGVSPGQEPPGKRGLYFHRNKKKTKELKRRMGNL